MSNPTKVIFLDVDGVLCVPHKQVAQGETDIPHLSQHLDDESCAQLKRIVDQTGAAIVMSSVWRFDWEDDGRTHFDDGVPVFNLMTHLRKKFAEVGIPLPIDRTPLLGHRWMDREFEILTWLKEKGQGVETWIAIDDDMLNLGPFYFKTSHFRGIEPWIADRAIEFLNTPYKEIQLQSQKINVPFHETGIMSGAWFNGRIEPFEGNRLDDHS